MKSHFNWKTKKYSLLFIKEVNGDYFKLAVGYFLLVINLCWNFPCMTWHLYKHELYITMRADSLGVKLLHHQKLTID